MEFTFPQKILFKHCDPAGIVFYPRYFEIINDCIEAFFDRLGFPFEQLHPQAAVPTAQIETRFIAPSRHGDHLDLALGVIQVGRTSLGLECMAHCGDQQRFVSRSILVLTNSQGRPQNWPDDMRAAFTPYLRSMP